MISLLCFLFLGTIGWGVSLYLVKILLVSLSPIDIVFYRMVIGFITLSLLSLALRLKITNLKGLVLDGLVVGLFNMSIPFYLTTYAEKHISSSLASIMNGLTPLFTFILGIVFFASKQRINLVSVISLSLGILGIALINQDVDLSHGSRSALLALLLTTISYGIAANYFKFKARTQQPILVAAMSAFISAISMLIFKLLMHSPFHSPFVETGSQLTALIWLGAIGSGVSLYLYCFLIKNTGAVFASMITYLMTITGVILGTVLLHETFTLVVAVGCALIVASLLTINHGAQFKKWKFRLVNT